MNKRLKNQVQLVVMVGCVVALTVAGNGTTCAASLRHAPAQKCTPDKPDLCVPFESTQLVGKSYDLKGKSEKRATILWVTDSNAWDMTAPVVLNGKKDSDTACTLVPGHKPMNENGSTLFITEEDGDQYMYLMSSGRTLVRKLTPTHRPFIDSNGKKQSAAVWLSAIPAVNDTDPYDYYVEFAKWSGNDDKLKHFRVEAFPHKASAECDCERPNFEHPEMPNNPSNKLCLHLSPNTLPGESSSGEGNEPGHN